MATNNITGNGNWFFTEGQWQSSDGDTLDVNNLSTGSNASNSGENPFAGGGITSGGNSIAGGDAISGGNRFGGDGNASSGGGNPIADDSSPFASFIGGGNQTVTSEDGQYTYNYERPLDERALTDTNNPFNQLLGVMGGGDAASGGGNPFAGGSGSSGDSDAGSGGGNAPSSDDTAVGGGNNPFASSSKASSDEDSISTGSGDTAAGGQLPGNLPFGDAPPSLEEDSSLPETGNGLPVPYNSDDWTSDLSNLDSDANASGNTGSGNGNWNLESDNTTNGNGNWNFGSDNQTSGNGNWNYADGNTATGNGNWNFGTDNLTNGNGNWQLGEGNTVLGNANMPEGSGNDILGSGNTSDVSNSNLLGNRIETSDDGKTVVGNEGWAFPVSDSSEMISLGSSQPSQAIGTDISNGVSSLLSSDNLAESAMANPGYNNSDYVFQGLA